MKSESAGLSILSEARVSALSRQGMILPSTGLGFINLFIIKNFSVPGLWICVVA